MAELKIKVNRAPVLTLWASVVAERLGHDEETALTLGRALAGLNAQSKGRRLGIYEARPEGTRPSERRPAAKVTGVPLMGREIPAIKTPKGVRAADKDKPMDPETVRRYLQSKFGDQLPLVRRAMQELASSLEPRDLAEQAYALYEHFRPEVPRGTKGWGAIGELSLERIRRLAR